MLSLLADMEQSHPGRLSLVVSSNPDAGGLVKAKAMGVVTEVVDYRLYHGNKSAFEAALQVVLSAHEIDVVCLAGFMRILGEEFVSAWHRRILNIHPSLLPKYRGLNTYQRALDAGDTEAGCTVHEVVPALDAGPILGQSRVAILPGDTVDDLAARTLMQEHRLYPIVLRDFLTRFELQS